MDPKNLKSWAKSDVKPGSDSPNQKKLHALYMEKLQATKALPKDKRDPKWYDAHLAWRAAQNKFDAFLKANPETKDLWGEPRV